jgi:hypothetical protein
MYSLALRHKWGTQKQDTLKKLINSIPSVDINNSSIINRFAELDVYRLGKHPEKPLAWIPTDPEAINIRALKKYNIWPYSLNFTLLLFLKVIPTININ